MEEIVMNTEKMTVHRALAELKTLDARIQKIISSTKYCFANKHSNTKVNGIEIDDYIAEMKDNYKSVKALINRRNAMRKAVVLSNATTEVEIASTKYRVAEAIEMKNHGMYNYQVLVSAIIRDKAVAQEAIDKYNGTTLEKKADDYVIGLYGSKEKASGTEAGATRKAYIEANTYDFVDPLGITSIQKNLEDMIANFSAEVDAALSVSNAITEIEFSYEVE